MIGVRRLPRSQQFIIDTLVSRIRGLRKTNANVNIMSTNNSYKNIRGFVEELSRVFATSLPYNHRKDVTSYRIYLRQIADIAANNYAGRQRFHVNESRSPTKGKAFLQFIYFIETPKRGGKNAPVEDRGTLLLVSSAGKVREVVPEQGKFVFFSPDDTYHEVAKQENPDMGSVSRNMIIGMLYRRSPNTQTVNRQIRMSSPRARTTRAVVGRVPLNSDSVTGTNANAITSLVRQLKIKPTKKKVATPTRTSIKSKRPSKPRSSKSRRLTKISERRGM